MLRPRTSLGAGPTAPIVLPGIVPVLIDQIDLPRGVSEAERLLCSSGFNIGQLVVIGLVLLSMYFLLKAIVRAVNRQIRGGLYSLIAAVIPICFPTVLAVLGVDTTCLVPG